MTVGYEMRWYLAEVSALTVSKRNSRLPSALRDDTLELGNFTLVSFLCSASVSRKYPAEFVFTVEKKIILKMMPCARGAQQYAR